MEVKQIPLPLVHPSPMNPRKTFDQEGIEELAENIEKQGLLQPITVRPIPMHDLEKELQLDQAYEIVCGERRFRAYSLLDQNSDTAKFAAIPAIVREMTDEQAFDAMITENLQRKDIDPVEEAFSFGLLVENGSTAEEIAVRFGKSIRFVQDRIKLNALIPELKEELKKGQMPIVSAMMIAKLAPEIQTAFWKGHKDWYGGVGPERWDRKTSQQFIDSLFMGLNYAPWYKAGEPGFEGSCGKRCDLCEYNTANHGCLFYEMNNNGLGKCTDRAKFNEKKTSYALHVVETHADQLVKSGNDLVQGKAVVGISIPSWEKEAERKAKEAMADKIRQMGFEVVNPLEYFHTICSYRMDDERTAEKLAKGECYRVLEIFAYSADISPEMKTYYVKKDDNDTNKNELGMPLAVQNLIKEYESESKIQSSLTTAGATAIGKTVPNIAALNREEKIALAMMLTRDCNATPARKEIGLDIIPDREKDRQIFEEKIDTLFPAILRFWMIQTIKAQRNEVIYHIEKDLPTLGKLWCYDEYKASQDAVIAKRDKKLAVITKKLQDLGYSPSGKKLIKPKTYTTEDKKKAYEEMKKKHPDAMLLFRVGDFYEIFEADAPTACLALGLTLVSRNGMQFCGFPAHALDNYVPKLIRQGYRVAICEQLDQPE